MTRGTGTVLPDFLLIMAHAEIIHLLQTAPPFFPDDGQRWFGVYVGEPRIMQKSLLALRHVLFGTPLPRNFNRPNPWPLAMLGMSTALALFALFVVVGYISSIALEAQLGGLGVAVFLSFVGFFILWWFLLYATIGRRREIVIAEMIAERGGRLAAFAGGEAADEDIGRVVDPETQETPARAAGAARVVWSLILLGLLFVAFLPYDYSTGGNVTILPSNRAQAVARTAGEITKVMVAEGDVVKPGTPLAQLSNWDQQNAVNVTVAQLAQAKAQLKQLQDEPTPEQLALAQSQLEAATVSLTLAKAQLDRNTTLLKTGTVSQQTWDASNSTYQQDLANIAVAKANLKLVQAGATPDQIAAAQANVDQLTQQLSFDQDNLKRTVIVAPMGGRIVTQNLSLLQGTYLKVGDPLLTIEDLTKVSAAISVPESDVALIRPGSDVWLRVYSHAGQQIQGQVTEIAPTTTTENYGTVVTVDAVFDNKDGFLNSGMTGYAKIEGEACWSGRPISEASCASSRSTSGPGSPEDEKDAGPRAGVGHQRQAPFDRYRASALDFVS